MFDQIVESALNEISAEDAYSKFYSNLPKDRFFNLVNEYGKFDNFMKAIVNAISAKKNSFADAFVLINRYKTANNDVRIKFLQNFKKGAYEDIDDMLHGFDEI